MSALDMVLSARDRFAFLNIAPYWWTAIHIRICIIVVCLLLPTLTSAATIGMQASCICSKGTNSLEVYIVKTPTTTKLWMDIMKGGRFVPNVLVDVYGNCGAPQVCTPVSNMAWGIVNPRVPMNGPITIKLTGTASSYPIEGYFSFDGTLVK